MAQDRKVSPHESLPRPSLGERLLAQARESLALAGVPLWGAVVGSLVLLVLVGVVRGQLYTVLPVGLYLSLHILAEVLAIVVGFAIFVVHWNAAVSQRLRQPRALFLGAAFLSVALLDTMHLLAFPGMPGLIDAGTTERGIYYWLAARFWAAGALLWAVFIDPNTRNPLLRRPILLALNLLPVGLLFLADIQFSAEVGVFYTEGVGLTPLKIAAELVIMALSSVAAVLYWRLFMHSRDRSFAMIAGALALTVFSELAFTLYSTAFDTFNLLGHAYKVIAYFMIFDGLFVAALLRPYAQLDRTMSALETSNRELTRLRDHIEGELKRTIATLEQTSQAERLARESAEALASLARDIAAQVGLDELVNALVSKTKEIFGADFVALATMEDKAETVVWQALAGTRTDRLTLAPMPVNQGLVGKALALNQPVLMERIGEEPDFNPADYPILLSEGARTALAVPIDAGNKAFGAFVIGYRDDHHMSAEEIGLARGVADHAAVAMQNARLYDEINRRAAELDAVINAITDGVIVYDPVGNIVRLNRAATAMLGYGEAEYSQSIPERVRRFQMADPQGRPLATDELPPVRAMKGQTVVGQEVMLRLADGSIHRVAFSVAPVTDAQGRRLGAVSTLHDITDLVEGERRRDEFVRIVAHDIRQPLTIIQGQAQLMRHALASGNQARIEHGVGAILTSAKRMNAMIRDLVDSARLEMGRTDLHKQPVDLAGFVAEMLERMSGVMEAHRVRLETVRGPAEDGGEDGPPLVQADPDRLERILANLISNALKYSSPGTEVVLTVGWQESNALVTLRDEGPGIAPEHLAHIFERFYRANGEHKKESLGLGLYITRMLIEAHGGSIWAESEVGVGSTFTFTLPLA